MSAADRSLPTSLEHQKKIAKDLLHAFRAGDDAARARVRSHLPDKRRITLADAQFTIAREYGFASWTQLKSHIATGTHATAESIRARFKHAVETRDAAELRALLERESTARALINEPIFSFGAPALAHIAGDDGGTLANVLLEFGADPNRRSDWEPGAWHPLHSANQAVAELLLQAGAVPDACAAAHLGRLDLLARILDAEPARVHERGGDGQTPLHFATSREIADVLLDRGADIDARDLDHHGTPAQWMLAGKRDAGRYHLARYLVERGAATDVFLAAALGLSDRLREMLRADPSLLELRTHQGPYGERPPASFHIYTWSIGQNLSPIDVATRFDQPDVLAVLLEFASEKQRFLAACSQANATEAKRLLRARPNLLDELTPQERRVLPDAAWAANTGAVALMLELGFDPSVFGSSGGALLHCAAWEGAVACVEVALPYPAVQALINQIEPIYGGTPLGWCCHGAANCGNPNADHVAVARLLLHAGAQPRPEFLGAPPAVAAVLREWSKM